MTKILGTSVANAKQMSEYLLSKNKNPKFSRNISSLEFCRLYIEICAKEGVRGDIAFAQACKETGNFSYGGDVKYTQNNFAGLGATGGILGCTFKDIETGILAQAQHLKSYATKDQLNEPCVDARRTTWFMSTKGGTSPHVETLSGTWAVPGYNTKLYKNLDDANKAKDSYGYQIINILNDILKIKERRSQKMAYTLKTNYADKSNYGSYRATSKIKYIVWHYTANDGDTDEANAIYFKRKNLKSSAHYFVDDDSITISVPDTYVAWSVGGSRYSNYKTTGGAKFYKICTNTNSLNIELCDTVRDGSYNVSEKTLNNAIELTRDLMKKYNISIENVIRHFDVTGKSCPTYFVNNIKWNTVKARISPSTSNSNTDNTYTFNQFVRDIQSAIGVIVDGSVGSKTLAALPTVSKSKNNRHAVIKPLQKYLTSIGYDCGNADGVAGSKFDNAAKAWAKANNCTADGEFTKGGKSWKTILKYNSITISTNTSSKKFMYNGVDYSLVFDPVYYAKNNEDVVNVYGTTATKLFEHFRTHGMREGRQGSASFNVEIYKNNYNDLKLEFGNDLASYYKHYVQCGFNEGRSAI